MNNFKLVDLDKPAKIFISSFLITMLIGILIGIGFIYYTTDMNPSGTIEHYRGSEVLDDEIPEEFPKPMEQMILSTHAHVNSFALISLILGIVFYFNSFITGKLKLFIMIEPFIATIITFSSLWLLRYVNDQFVYLVMISSFIMYMFWITMILISLYELNKKSPK
mgnify:CR=1 FL=1|tara:strand:+ start:194 stop:688 length:495 start_codon:yes stop_codon:yes gene_type:complete